MPDNYEVAITLQAVDLASESIRQARAELDRLLASADAIRSGGLPDAVGLSGGLADGQTGGTDAAGSLTMAEQTSQALSQQMDSAAAHAADFQTNMSGALESASGIASVLSTLAAAATVIPVRINIENRGELETFLGGLLAGAVRAAGGGVPGEDVRVNGR